MKRSIAVTALVVIVELTSVLAARAEDTAGPPPSTPSSPTSGRQLDGLLKGGFVFSTAEGEDELRISAAAHLDSRAFFGDSVAPDSFDIRRARLDIRATVHSWMTMRVQAAMEGSPYIRNAWLDLLHSDALHLRLGQMKVPFSTEWLTRDNQVNFLERGTSTPVYPFFDRGLLLWGRLGGDRLTYNLGLYSGAGVDADSSKGDVDDHKDVSARLFAQPFRDSADIFEGLYLVAEGTWGATSAPTRRFEQRGLAAADYQSQLWSWRTEQMIGTNGRASDQISGEIDSRRRWGAEVLYSLGPFSASLEWLEIQYDDIAVYHDYWVGSQRVEHRPVLHRDGGVRSVSAWASLFLTGEHKQVSNFGWKQPDPHHPYVPGSAKGWGAWELLIRFSSTETDPELFDTECVSGFGADDLPEGMPAVGQDASLTAAILKGASRVNEATLGLNWTVNHNFRIQLNASRIWAPDWSEGTEGIVSGGGSNLADRTTKGVLVESEYSMGLRFIFRI